MSKKDITVNTQCLICYKPSPVHVLCDDCFIEVEKRKLRKMINDKTDDKSFEAGFIYGLENALNIINRHVKSIPNEVMSLHGHAIASAVNGIQSNICECGVKTVENGNFTQLVDSREAIGPTVRAMKKLLDDIDAQTTLITSDEYVKRIIKSSGDSSSN